MRSQPLANLAGLELDLPCRVVVSFREHHARRIREAGGWDWTALAHDGFVPRADTCSNNAVEPMRELWAEFAEAGRVLGVLGTGGAIVRTARALHVLPLDCVELVEEPTAPVDEAPLAAIRRAASAEELLALCTCVGPARDAHDRSCPVRLAHPRRDLGDPPVLVEGEAAAAIVRLFDLALSLLDKPYDVRPHLEFLDYTRERFRAVFERVLRVAGAERSRERWGLGPAERS